MTPEEERLLVLAMAQLIGPLLHHVAARDQAAALEQLGAGLRQAHALLDTQLGVAGHKSQDDMLKKLNGLANAIAEETLHHCKPIQLHLRHLSVFKP